VKESSLNANAKPFIPKAKQRRQERFKDPIEDPFHPMNLIL